MFKSELSVSFDSFNSINSIAQTAFGEVNWKVSSTVTGLSYEADDYDDDVIGFMTANILTTLEHDGRKIMIKSTGSREVFGSELGHYEYDNGSFSLDFFNTDGSKLSKEVFFKSHPELIIQNYALNSDAVTLFSLLPCSGEQAGKFSGIIPIQ